MSVLVNLLLGLLFGIGLVVSGMADPAKVLNFLDLAGTWDPSLLFVMGGAAITTFVGYRFVLKRSRPLLAEGFQLPSRRDIDGRLLFGAGLFGIGWGLGGFCPGPVLTTIGLGATGTLWFVPAMFVGMLIARQAASR
jgi:uncharacterized membrane protein YedE/YeeE